MTEILRWFFGVKRSIPQLLDLEAKLNQDLVDLERQVQEQYYIAGRAYSENDDKVTKAALRKKNQIVEQHIRLTEYLKNVEATRGERERELEQKYFGMWPRGGTASSSQTKTVPTIVVHPPPEESVEMSSGVTHSIGNLVQDMISSYKDEHEQDHYIHVPRMSNKDKYHFSKSTVVDIEKEANANSSSSMEDPNENEEDVDAVSEKEVQDGERTPSFL